MNSQSETVASFTRRVLRKPAVLDKTGLTASALDREVRAGRFPSPFKLTANERSRAIGWFESEVDRYLEERAKAGAL